VKSSTTVPGAAVVVVVLVVVEVVVGTGAVDVLVVEVVVVVVGGIVVVAFSVKSSVPGRLVAPGPGSAALALMMPFMVAGTQKVDASVSAAGTPGVIGPAGCPTSRMSRHELAFGFVKQPCEDCDGQKRPLALDSSAVLVESGVKSTGISPTNCAHVPPGQSPAPAHGAPLFVPRKQRCPEAVAAGTQSRVSPFEFVLVHAVPWLPLPSHTPVHGLAGEPLQTAPDGEPTRQTGHG